MSDTTTQTCDACGATGARTSNDWNYVQNVWCDMHGTWCRRCLDRLGDAEVAAAALLRSGCCFTRKHASLMRMASIGYWPLVTVATRRILGAWAGCDNSGDTWQRWLHEARMAAGCTFNERCCCDVCEEGGGGQGRPGARKEPLLIGYLPCGCLLDRDTGTSPNDRQPVSVTACQDHQFLVERVRELESMLAGEGGPPSSCGGAPYDNGGRVGYGQGAVGREQPGSEDRTVWLTAEASLGCNRPSLDEPLSEPSVDDLIELDDLMELDDLPGTVDSVCDGDPPPGWDECDDDPDDEDCDIEGLGPPLSRPLSRYAWDAERNCPYRIEPDGDDRYCD